MSTLTVNFILFFWTSFRSRILQKEGKNVLREAIHYFLIRLKTHLCNSNWFCFVYPNS
ncbi:hypothetical protein LEP1GSC186_0878 [Leptospira noguchii serovar Autumnalis str. ZUN142]|uniref:Uncharacterized protein n=2 Tax=Leptospira noguchii TaxID=28182 RepID=M6UNL7_9LEPT|nr:hypothetical protein LEP1GSC035_0665 [Leptospira noguchii str. 2007001578]EMO42639.1 hypothetical protein LEP1GSC186_0878 [Leptospira noguchii serovar Autumnalis str. ZUN142]